MIGRRGEWAPVCRLRLDRAEKVKKTWFSCFISVTILGVQNASLCVLFAGEVVHVMNPSTVLSLSSQSGISIYMGKDGRMRGREGGSREGRKE